MTNPRRLILCELSGRWATALAREWHGERLQIVATRSLAECGERLAETPEALVAVELTDSNLDSSLAWLSEFGRSFPAAEVLVLARRGLEPYEALARELGALHFTTSPRQLGPVAEMAYARQVSRSQGSLAEQIMAELPWGQG